MSKESRPERPVFIVAIVLSVLLTALTVWAVAQQSRALEQRDLADLRRTAEQAAARMDDAFRRDLEDTFDTANLAYTAGGVTWVNYWAAGQKRWPLVFIRANGAKWEQLPRPGTVPLPSVGSSGQEQPSPEVEALRQELQAQGPAVLAHLESAEVLQAASGPGGESRFEYLPEQRALLVRRSLSERVELVLAGVLAETVSRYGFAGDGTVEVLPPDVPANRTALARCSAAFANSVIQAGVTTEHRLQHEARRRAQYVFLTLAGSAAGWALLLWLMRRLIRGHREVVRIQKRIVADVSHELKTPLALIRLHAETLREGRIRDPQRQQDYLDTITRESERLTVLLDSILDFSKYERGQREYDFHECDLVVIARQAWSLYEPQFAASGFDARAELPSERVIVNADAHAMQQVLVNLLQNAYRYSRDRKFVRLRVKAEGHIGVVEVEDHGAGMTREQLRELGGPGRSPDPRHGAGAGDRKPHYHGAPRQTRGAVAPGRRQPVLRVASAGCAVAGAGDAVMGDE
jgi:signal transduction histidine kinase